MHGLDHEKRFLEALQAFGVKQASEPGTTEEVETTDRDKEKGTTSVPLPPSRVSSANLFTHPEAHPIVLDMALIRKYGVEWMEWEPETLEIRIPEDFKVSGVSDLNLSKIQACKTLHLVDSYWQRWEVFGWCTMSFNGVFPNFDTMQVPAVGQILVSVDTANRIREDVAWSEEVQSYIRAVYKHDGIVCTQPPADFVHILTDKVDMVDVDRRWHEEIRASRKAPTGDNHEDEQLRRILAVDDYLEEYRTRLHQQIGLVVDA